MVSPKKKVNKERKTYLKAFLFRRQARCYEVNSIFRAKQRTSVRETLFEVGFVVAFMKMENFYVDGGVKGAKRGASANEFRQLRAK